MSETKVLRKVQFNLFCIQQVKFSSEANFFSHFVTTKRYTPFPYCTLCHMVLLFNIKIFYEVVFPLLFTTEQIQVIPQSKYMHIQLSLISPLILQMALCITKKSSYLQHLKALHSHPQLSGATWIVPGYAAMTTTVLQQQ